ncbi:MAG: hypothetical protein LBF12_05080 [Christensenellaceae bacterium]|jgi:beta-galactosidase/beta-glucuronidase|nr:hypothetical protein [Christensenellaceae bacterium]
MEKVKHPRPDMLRKNFTSLDGEWKFCIGSNRELPTYYINAEFAETVCVPDHTSFNNDNAYNDVWYKRFFTITAEQLKGKAFINFLGVGESTNIYINGTPCMARTGEKSNFCFEISQILNEGENQIVVNVFRTKERNTSLDSSKVFGIWRSVWIEFTSNAFLSELKTIAAQDGSAIILRGLAASIKDGYAINVITFKDDQPVASYRYEARDKFTLSIPMKDQITPWAPNNPKIYNVEVALLNERGEILDLVYTYFAYRTLKIINGILFISGQKTQIRGIRVNNEHFFVSDYEEKCKKIRKLLATSLSLGFNTIFLPYYYIDPVFRYYADKIGMIIIEEINQDPTIFGDKQLIQENARDIASLISDESRSPSIIMRSLFTGFYTPGFLADYMYNVAKSADPYTIITSGGGLVYAADIIEYSGPCANSAGYVKRLMGDAFSFKNEKCEKKFRAQNPTLAQVSKISKLAKILNYFNCGDVPYHDVMAEYDFIKIYSHAVKSINSLGVLGWIYDGLYDTPASRTGFFIEDGSAKLSRLASDTLKQLNLKQ